MKFIYIFVALILALNQICCLRSDDFCKKDTKKNKIFLHYDCVSSFCSFDKITCDYFISWRILLKKWINLMYARILLRKSKQNDYKNQWI